MLNHARLFLCFVYGYILMSDDRFRATITRQWPLALLLALATLAVLGAVAARDGFDPTRDLPLAYSPRYVGYWSISAVCTWSWVVLMLGLGQRYLTASSSLLGYASAAVLPFYVLHMLVIGIVMLAVSTWNIGIFPSFVVISGVSLLGTLALCEAIRRLRMTDLLHGPRRRTLSSLPLVTR